MTEPSLNAQDIIRMLDLKPLPAEGGYYSETYRADERFPAEALAPRYGGPRSFGTAIYFLLTPETRSVLHRLKSDEIYHFYLGDPVEMLTLGPSGCGEVKVLGAGLEGGQRQQVLVPRGVWQGSRLVAGGDFALLGTTVAPGFEFEDFEPGDPRALAAAYPSFADLIRALGE